jgi:hypothetical protein
LENPLKTRKKEKKDEEDTWKGEEVLNIKRIKESFKDFEVLIEILS